MILIIFYKTNIFSHFEQESIQYIQIQFDGKINMIMPTKVCKQEDRHINIA